MTIQQKMKAEKENLLNQIAILETLIRKSPPGNLSIVSSGSREKWYVAEKSDSPGRKNRKYLTRKDQKLAEALGRKKYRQAVIRDLEKKTEAIDVWLKSEGDYDSEAEKLLEKSPVLKKIISETAAIPEPVREWMKRDHVVSEYHSENLVIETKKGMYVRSKSEHIIASALEKRSIPYKYEIQLILSGSTVFPDFTIMHPQTNQLFYWEHFGMMDDERYFEKSMIKLRKYISNGYVPGINLIITFETSDKPLSVQLVENLVDYYFI